MSLPASVETRIDYYGIRWLREAWLQLAVLTGGSVWLMAEEDGSLLVDADDPCVFPVWPSEAQVADWAGGRRRPVEVPLEVLSTHLAGVCGVDKAKLELWPSAAGQGRRIGVDRFEREIRTAESESAMPDRVAGLMFSPEPASLRNWIPGFELKADLLSLLSATRSSSRYENEAQATDDPWWAYRQFHRVARRRRAELWIARVGHQVITCRDAHDRVCVPVWTSKEDARSMIGPCVEDLVPECLGARAFVTHWLSAIAGWRALVAVVGGGDAVVVGPGRLALDLRDDAPPIPRRKRCCDSK